MRPKILFFIDGARPTKEELDASKKIEGLVCFRNVNFVNNDCSLEGADYVTGKSPKNYLDHYERLPSSLDEHGDQKSAGTEEETAGTEEETAGTEEEGAREETFEGEDLEAPAPKKKKKKKKLGSSEAPF